MDQHVDSGSMSGSFTATPSRTDPIRSRATLAVDVTDSPAGTASRLGMEDYDTHERSPSVYGHETPHIYATDNVTARVRRTWGNTRGVSTLGNFAVGISSPASVAPSPLVQTTTTPSAPAWSSLPISAYATSPRQPMSTSTTASPFVTQTDAMAVADALGRSGEHAFGESQRALLMSELGFAPTPTSPGDATVSSEDALQGMMSPQTQAQLSTADLPVQWEQILNPVRHVRITIQTLLAH